MTLLCCVVMAALSFLLTEETHGFRLSSYRNDLLSLLVSKSSGRRKLKADESGPFLPRGPKLGCQLELLPSRHQQAEYAATTQATTMTWLSSTSLRGGATVLLATATTNPVLSSMWPGLALACALAYALYNVFIKKAASASMDPILGGVLLQIVAATLGAALLAVTQASSKSVKLTTSRMGITWAICAGVAVGVAEILSFVISSMGVPASKSIPTIVGGSVVLGTLLGAMWLGEHLSPRGWLGIILIAGGIALVGMDPGSSAMH
jgi:bacterial/archaeal transporter family protein